MALKPSPPDLLVDNELLTNEVHRLRSRVSELEGQLREARGQVRTLRRTIAQEMTPGAEQAAADMRYLLGRLSTFPIGQLVRRSQGFRNLAERYGVG